MCVCLIEHSITFVYVARMLSTHRTMAHNDIALATDRAFSRPPLAMMCVCVFFSFFFGFGLVRRRLPTRFPHFSLLFIMYHMHAHISRQGTYSSFDHEGYQVCVEIIYVCAFKLNAFVHKVVDVVGNSRIVNHAWTKLSPLCNTHTW